MCELLVRIRDKVDPDDARKNARITKRGDVIVVAPDGAPWGKVDLSAPFWRIVRVPDMTVSEGEQFLAPEINESREPSFVLQRRQFKLDLDALDAAYFADDDKRPAEPITIAAAALLGVKRLKPPQDDPFVFGAPADVMG